jgi:hypothetical protein
LDVIYLPILYSLILTTIIFVGLGIILKNWTRSGVVASLFLILFFSYGHIKSAAGISPQLILFAWTVLFLAGLFYLTRARIDLFGLTKFLNIVSLILVAFSLANVVYFEVSTNRISRYFMNYEKSDIALEAKLAHLENPPDIYYLIFDRYSNPKTLQETYGFEITDFTNFLEGKGFYLASNSRSNYPRTFLSLGSSLNMEYLNYLPGKFGEESNDETAAYYLLQDYKVQKLLKSQGYRYVHIGSWWEPTRKNENADKNYLYNPFKSKGLDLDEFSTKLIQTTLLSEFLARTSQEGLSEPLYGRSNHREGILFQFKALDSVVENTKGPKFVFAHFLTPHFPYVLDQECNPIDEKVAKSRSSKENYKNQLVCTNKKIMNVVKKIMIASDKRAIIILQSDEGPDPISGRLEKEWQKSDVDSLKEKTSILNAYYLPGKSKELLSSSITPVNTFRVIFDLYFGADFEILNDEIYMVENKEKPYKFYKLTEKLR